MASCQGGFSANDWNQPVVHELILDGLIYGMSHSLT